MNPINTSLAGTSVAPRSPRMPRSPLVQPRFSPIDGKRQQHATHSYQKAENGQLTGNIRNHKGNETCKEAAEKAKKTQNKGKLKRCIVM